MKAELHLLSQRLALRSGEALEQKPRPTTQPSGLLSWLNPRCVHEFFTDAGTANEWETPLTLLAGLAGELAADAPIVWMGRCCWPTFQHLQRAGEKLPQGPAHHVFLDPLSELERQWGLLEAARSPAVGAVVADGSGIDTTAGRRLQLAAETGNAVVLLARPAPELAAPSWAATRWRVSPLPSLTGQPRWSIALVRATGARQGQDASRHWVVSWTYEVFRGAGSLDLSSAVGCGAGPATVPGQTPAARQQSA